MNEGEAKRGNGKAVRREYTEDAHEIPHRRAAVVNRFMNLVAAVSLDSILHSTPSFTKAHGHVPKIQSDLSIPTYFQQFAFPRGQPLAKSSIAIERARVISLSLDPVALAPIYNEGRQRLLSSWVGGVRGMNNTTAYTPLESLLLFQSLFAWGTESVTFSRISEALKKHELINQAPTYDPGRLSSDALRELYKRWLRDEREEGENREESGSPPPSKKRKLQSPGLAPTEDRDEHMEKLARLVDRSYALYAKSIVREIREDERKYALLEREIREIESRESEKPSRDEHVENARDGSTPLESRIDRRSSSSRETAQPERILDVTNRQGSVQTKEVRRQPLDPSPPAPSPSSRSDGFAISDLVNGPTPPRTTPQESISHSRNGSHSSQNAYQFSTRPPPLQTGPPGMIGSQVHNNWTHQTGPVPFQTYQHAPNHSPQFAAPFSPSQHHHRASFSGPGMPPHHSPIPASPLTTSGRNSVIQLPPLVPQPSRSSASPARSLDTLADLAGQQNHMPASPYLQQGINAYSIYGGQPYSNNYNLEGRPQSGGYPPHHQIAPVNSQAHVPTPNFPPQPPVGYSHSRSTENPLVVRQQPNAQYTSPYNGAQNGLAPISSAPDLPSRIASLSTPLRPLFESRQSLSNLPQTPAMSAPLRPINSTGRMRTRWKPLDTLPPELTPKFKGPHSPKRPTPEPLSPVLVPAKLPPTATAAAAPKASKENPKSSKKNADKPKGSERKKQGTQRNRAGSTASSVVADSNRSQSEMSHADESSLDHGIPSRRVKQEVGTPRVPIDNDIEASGEVTADESLPLPNSRRRGMLRDEVEPSPRASMKRKRIESPAPSPRKPAGPATHVIWTRNFSKICASALDSIGGHKNASIFSAPVKDRDAPQYSSLIKYPQNLKSIRTAINAGTRAAAAAANAAGFDQSQMTVKLPISDELIPPHGIVNTQQLEKEVAHMFANAVMYNPSPTGFVPWFKNAVEAKKQEQKDAAAGKKQESTGQENYDVEEFAVFNETTTMSKDVDKIFGELKAAERPLQGDFDVNSTGSVGRVDGESVRAVEDDEEDELAGDGDGVGVGHGGMGSIAKRRRRA